MSAGQTTAEQERNRSWNCAVGKTTGRNWRPPGLNFSASAYISICYGETIRIWSRLYINWASAKIGAAQFSSSMTGLIYYTHAKRKFMRKESEKWTKRNQSKSKESKSRPSFGTCGNSTTQVFVTALAIDYSPCATLPKVRIYSCIKKKENGNLGRNRLKRQRRKSLFKLISRPIYFSSYRWC